jgi:IS30 family transposase
MYGGVAMPESYHQLSAEERAAIAIGLEQGLSCRAIARRLKRSPSTVVRELRRNGGRRVYHPVVARKRSCERRFRPQRRLDADPALWRRIVRWMQKGWSPEQCAGTLKAMHPDDPEKRVSHETIYAHIYAHPRGELRTALIKMLRQSRKTRRPRARGKDRRGQLQDITPISERPQDVETRAVPGHWEGDLIKGKYNRSAVGTLVERTSRYVILVRLDDAKAPTVHRGFVRKMKPVPKPLRKSLTYDRGREMALHKKVAADLELAVYFADPHAPWQRGSNENTNGLVREYLPKGTDLSIHSQTDLNKIAHLLNTRPRKKLAFQTPEEVYLASLNGYPVRQGVAIES